MKYCPVILIARAGVVSSALFVSTMVVAGPYPFKVIKEKEGVSEVVVVRNEGFAPVEAKLSLSGAGFQSSEQWPITVRLAPRTEQRVSNLYPSQQGKPYYSVISSSLIIGDRDAKTNDEFNYLIPFRDGTVFDIITKEGLGFSKHNNSSTRNALDFGVPTGKIVTAARDGIVIQKANDNPSAISEFGAVSQAQIERANHVMILHDDGTIGFYAHLYNGSVEISEGMRVQAGQKIGLAGAVADTPINFIHFAILRSTTEGLVSIPIHFRDPYRNIRLDIHNGGERVRVGTREEGTLVALMDKDRKNITRVVQHIGSTDSPAVENVASRSPKHKGTPSTSVNRAHTTPSEQEIAADTPKPGSSGGQKIFGMVVIAALLSFAFSGKKAPKTKQNQSNRLEGHVPLSPSGEVQCKGEKTARGKKEPFDRTCERVINYRLLEIMEWRRFEVLVAEYFRQRGDVAILNEFGADGGIDVQVRVKATGRLIAIQCKSWRHLVGVKVVRELFGALKLAGIENGEIFSRSGFSSDALIEAEKLGISLVSGAKFITMINALPSEKVERLFDIATDGDFMTPSCASCGLKMNFHERRPAYWMCPKHNKIKIYASLS